MKRENTIVLTPNEVEGIVRNYLTKIDSQFAAGEHIDCEHTEAGGLRFAWSADVGPSEADAAEQLLIEEINQRHRSVATYAIDDPADNPAGEKEGVSTIERAVQATVPVG